MDFGPETWFKVHRKGVYIPSVPPIQRDVVNQNLEIKIMMKITEWGPKSEKNAIYYDHKWDQPQFSESQVGWPREKLGVRF